MSVEVHIFSRAEKNISDAFTYYEHESPGLGEAFLEYVEEVIGNLTDYPELYQKIFGEVRRANLHRFPYAVFYLYEHGEVVILNVLDTRQDIEALLERT